MVIMLLVLALASALVALFTVNQATMGVGFLIFGCLLAIVARIVQAQQHHKALVDIMRTRVLQADNHHREILKPARQAEPE